MRRVEYFKRKIERIDRRDNILKIRNNFEFQPLKVRIETLCSASPYDLPSNIVLADFTGLSEFADRESAEGIAAGIGAPIRKIPTPFPRPNMA